MSSAQSWEGLIVAACAVGGFGVTIGRLLKKARADEKTERQKEIADAIADAKLKQDLADAKEELERRKRRDG